MDKDGTRYSADASGHITVDNPVHDAEIRSKAGKYVHARITGFTSLPGERCTCGFTPHSFSIRCPRCGATLKEL